MRENALTFYDYPGGIYPGGIIIELIKTVAGVRKSSCIADRIIDLHCVMTIFWKACAIQSLHTKPLTS